MRIPTKAMSIIEKSMRQYEKNSEGRGECHFKRFTEYEGNICAEVYVFQKGSKPTEDNIELWGIDYINGNAGLICE